MPTNSILYHKMLELNRDFARHHQIRFLFTPLLLSVYKPEHRFDRYHNHITFYNHLDYHSYDTSMVIEI